MVILTTPGSKSGFSNRGFWFGYNLLCELDSAGEYYFDSARKSVLFWPKDKRSAKRCQVTYSDSILHIPAGLENVTFEGFVFENCRGTAIRSTQWTRSVSFVACVVRNVGGVGVSLKGAMETSVVGCDIYDCGAGGVLVRGGNGDRLVKSCARVENCHIHHYARRMLSCAPAVKVKGCGISIARNTIHDGPHCAIDLSGPENRVCSNEIFSVCLDCGEIGAIYAYRSWLYCGTEVKWNFIHDIYNPRWERNRGVMLDGSSGGVEIVSNCFLRAAEGISLSGIGNKVECNTFIDCKPPIEAWFKWSSPKLYAQLPRQCVDDVLCHPVHEDPWKRRYPYLYLMADALSHKQKRHPATRTTIKWNMTTESDLVLFVRWAPYSADGWDVCGNVERVSAKDKRLNLDWFQLHTGVYRSKERATWPVTTSVTIKSDRLVDSNGAGQNGRFVPMKKE